MRTSQKQTQLWSFVSCTENTVRIGVSSACRFALEYKDQPRSSKGTALLLCLSKGSCPKEHHAIPFSPGNDNSGNGGDRQSRIYPIWEFKLLQSETLVTFHKRIVWSVSLLSCCLFVVAVAAVVAFVVVAVW